MFQLLNPIALLAAAALIIPVMIHLWNTRKGKTLKVGSIALISESSKKPARSLQITNWPLLLLRCLLLLLLSLLLAKPLWQNDHKQKNGWMLIREYELGNAYQQYHTLIDSLTQQGFELRNLNPSREIIALQDTDFYQAKTISANSNTWSYIKYLDAALPDKFPVYIFSDQLAQNFSGQRPSVRMDFHWINLNAHIQSDTIPVSAYKDQAGQVITMRRISTPYGNFYENANTGSSSLKHDTIDTIHIGVYAGDNATDAKYLMAAINAIAAYTGRNIVINTSIPATPQQVIFWLQDTEPSSNVLGTLAPGGTILRYENNGNPSLQINSTASAGLFTLDGNDPDLFYKYTAGSSKGTALWTLANGEPLMTAGSTGSIRTLYFRSRFNPQWTNMVWKENFARLLLPIILSSPIEIKTDLRMISTEQAQPRPAAGPFNTRMGDYAAVPPTDLSFIVWIIVFLVFAAERLLAHHQTRQKNA